ncbi:MAG: cell division protein ZapB [Candidatus Electryonea clarkiae]|nr:cell division protein ZapB [Candidatus Electryonea clarkiae]MDP8287168.1 cell division protein ZapB [Candidatus Electryonea clarkiae]
MEFEAFKALEDKITIVLERVETLKQENSDLKNRLEVLQEEYNEKAAAFEQMSLDLKTAKEDTRDIEKDEKIRTKVAGLLEKLENF